MKRMKKMLAMLLAALMVFGAMGTALADSGSGTGKGKTEGDNPTELFDVVLPTFTPGTFDMYLDPHGLIQATGGARYKANVADANPFAAGTNLYFKNAGDTVSYSGSSDALKITNKSNMAVAVTLTAEADRGENEITFVDSASKLTAETEAAAMYLAVVNADDATKLAALADVEAGDDDDGESEATFEANKTDANNIIKSVALAWEDEISDEDKAATQELLKDKEISVAYAYAYDEDESEVTTDNFTVTLPVIAATTGFEVTKSPNTAVTGGNADQTVTVTFTKGTYVEDEESITGAEAVATVTIVLDGAAAQTYGNQQMSASAAATVTFGAAAAFASDSKAVLKGEIDTIEGAYKDQWNAEKQAYELVVDSSKIGDGEGKSQWKTLSFKLTGNINSADAWDDVEADNALNIKVTWDVVKKVANADAAPSVKVTEAAAAKSASGAETFTTLSYDLGKGEGAKDKVLKVQIIKENESDFSDVADNYVTIDSSAKTVKIKAVASVWSATKWQVVFSDSAGSESSQYAVEFNLKSAG